MAHPEFEVSADDRPLFQPAKPSVPWAALVAIALIVGAIAGGAYYLWQRQTAPPSAPSVTAPAAAPQPAPPASVEPPRIEHPVEQAGAPPAPTPLPALDDSDGLLHEALVGIFGAATVDALLRPQDFVRNVVATIDNLPRKSIALRLSPLKPVPGAFRVSGPEGALVAGDNAARYAPYVRAMEAIDSAKLVAIYVRLYPLFQQAYTDLGYPSRYFNDRVFEAIDDLLAAPEARGPLALTQPKVLYEYADPALQGLSAGQKIMVRMGPENEAKVKAKLREIKRALTRGT
jgi:hypothetical protein